MVRIMRLIWIAVTVAALVSCADTTPPEVIESPTTPWLPTAAAAAPTVAAETPTAAAAVEVPTVAAGPTKTPTAVPTVGGRPEIPSALLPLNPGVPDIYDGLMSMEEMILKSDVIARVRLQSTTPATTTSLTIIDPDRLPPPYPTSTTHWFATLEFRFTVSEYLKGSGGNEISAFVFQRFDFEERANAAVAVIAGAHDSRWNDREALVFLQSTNGWTRLGRTQGSAVLGADQYFFGDWSMLRYTQYGDLTDTYTLWSIYSKRWLPAAAGSAVRASTDKGAGKVFLLDVPATSGARGGSVARSAAASYVPDPPPSSSISLSDLKSKITAIEAEANAGGTPEYYECVRRHYWLDNLLRYWTLKGGEIGPRHFEGTITSGLPEGTFIVEFEKTRSHHRNTPGMDWFGGPDKDLVRFTYDAHSDEPTRFVTVNIATTRPLPAGEYEANLNGVWHGGVVCGLVSEYALGTEDLDLTVTHPQVPFHIDHEAFFDPVDIGGAVGADATNGVLKPAAFTHDGTTTTISSLKWENGTVTLGASPTTTMVGHAVDFIDVTGTTTLSLTSDNASTTPLTWTVPDKPWADGDLLMLRIRELPPPNPVTVTLTPRPQGRLTFFNLTVNWDDPQTCDGRYFVYVGTDGSLIRRMGYHEPTVSTASASTGWLYNDVPDFWAVVRCDPSDYGASREVGRVSLRAAVE